LSLIDRKRKFKKQPGILQRASLIKIYPWSLKKTVSIRVKYGKNLLTWDLSGYSFLNNIQVAVLVFLKQVLLQKRSAVLIPPWEWR